MIKIKYIERLFNTNDVCVPVFEIECNNKDDQIRLKNILKTNNNTYLLNTINEIFDIFTIEETTMIDNIMKEMDINYLNNERWEKYKNKNEIGISYNEINNPSFYCIMDKDSKIKLRFNARNEMYDIQQTNNIEEFNQITINHKNDGTYEDYYIEDTANNFKDILMIVLNMIFSSYYYIEVKKCRNCGKYYLTTNKGQLYCGRLYKDDMTCGYFNYYLKDTVINSGYSNIDKLRSRVYEKEKNRGKSYEFIDEEYKMIKEHYNNLNERVNFYLNYYKKEEDKKRNIRELDLEHLLNSKQ